MLKKKVSSKIVAVVFGVIVICFAVAVYVSAWDEPTVAPPGGNVDAPVNVGNTPQTKTGGLTIDGLFTARGIFSAFGGSGSAVLNVVGSDVGIGTSTPSAKLEVVGGAVKTPDGLIIDTCSNAANNCPDDLGVPEDGQMWLVLP